MCFEHKKYLCIGSKAKGKSNKFEIHKWEPGVVSPIDAIVHVGRQQQLLNLSTLDSIRCNSELLLGAFEVFERHPIECVLAGGIWHQMALATLELYGTQHCC